METLWGPSGAIEASLSLLALSFFLSFGVGRFVISYIQIGAKSSQKHAKPTPKASVWPLGKPGVNWQCGDKRLTFLEAKFPTTELGVKITPWAGCQSF